MILLGSFHFSFSGGLNFDSRNGCLDSKLLKFKNFWRKFELLKFELSKK